MPAQSKFIRFLKRCCCCCCSTSSTDTEPKRSSSKSKMAQKETRKNNKKQRQRERRERRAKKSKHDVVEQSFHNLTADTGLKTSASLDSNNNIKVSKHLQPSASFPNLKTVKKHLLPLWKPRSMPNMLKSSKMSFLKRPNVPPTTLSISQQSLHVGGHLKSVVTLNEIQVTLKTSTSSSLSSREELEIPPPSLLNSSSNCSVSTSSTSFPLGDWDIISINDILDGISPPLPSSFSTSSSFSFLEEDSTQTPETRSPSPEINSTSSSASPSIEMNIPQSDQGVNEDHAVTDELPHRIVPKMKKFYYELWPPNPWLSPKYNGFPEEKKLKPHERDNYWTTDRDDDPLQVNEGVQFTWCDATGTVKVVREYQDSCVSEDITLPQSSDELIDQTQSEAKIRSSADKMILTDDDSGERKETVKFCLLSSAPFCSDDNSEDSSNVTRVKTRDALRQRLFGDDVLSEQQLDDQLAMILSSTPTFPIDDMKCANFSKFHHPGHVYSKRLSQFNIDSESFDTNSCAISHTLLAVTFYLFGLQSGDLFDSHNLQSTSITKWLWKTVYVGNALHRSLFKRPKCILATEAFKVVRDYFHLHSLTWRSKHENQGILSKRLRKLPTNFSLDIVNPYNLKSSLAFHATKLDPAKGEAILYSINRNIFLLVPTLDDRVVLIDIHPHLSFGGGAIILFCPKITRSVQDMLDEFYLKTIKPFYSYCLGLANIICCPLNEDTKLIPRSLEEWNYGI